MSEDPCRTVGGSVAHRSMREIVFEFLRDEILSGRLRPGESLNTMDLSRRLGVSRTPIREAMNRLVSVGLVENTPYRSASVKALSIDEIIEIYCIRAALSGECARLAAKRLTRELRDRLLALCREMEQAAAAGNHAVLLERNREFHGIVIEAAHLPKLEELLLEYFRRSRSFSTLGLELPGRAEEVCREHRLIAESISRGDPEASDRWTREHYLHTARWIAASMGLKTDI